MLDESSAASSVWSDAGTAAALLAVDPALGGVTLRAMPGPVRDVWLANFQALLPAGRRPLRIPLHVTDSRLLGGLDLTATLRSGRPVAERGLLSTAHGGFVILAMAERIEPGPAARIGSVLDTGELQLERDGFRLRQPARFGVVALDEGISEEERPPAGLRDRLAFEIDLRQTGWRDCVDDSDVSAADIEAARQRLAGIASDDAALETLCAASVAFGVESLRAPVQALRAARAAAALARRNQVDADDLMLAARLVFSPRATRIPITGDEQPSASEPRPESLTDPADGESSSGRQDADLGELTIAAVAANLPEALLQALEDGSLTASRRQVSGTAGRQQKSPSHGRPAGSRAGRLGNGARLHVIDTLRAAAPWQPLRARETRQRQGLMRVHVRAEDFRLKRFVDKTGSTTIFAVDASGSTALQRLAEAKGAVELLLSDCYLRRARVALVAFRGSTAELLLPPTGSLLRAKRALSGLPGGGGTPLAAGIELARLQAEAVQRRGEQPTLVLLTDGRANITLDGKPDRARATEDALTAARGIAATGIPALLIDTSARPRQQAAALAENLAGDYLPLPYVDASLLSGAVRQFTDRRTGVSA